MCQVKNGCGFWIQKVCGIISYFHLCVCCTYFHVSADTYTCVYTCMGRLTSGFILYKPPTLFTVAESLSQT